MNATIAPATYEFNYRGYSIVHFEADDTFSVVENGKEFGNTTNLIDLIRGIDGQWAKFGR
jgi:hypothetical protein